MISKHSLKIHKPGVNGNQKWVFGYKNITFFVFVNSLF